MKISASIYSNPKDDLVTNIKQLDLSQVDYFHVDCNDEPGVFEDIRKIREMSARPIDLHIITPHPSKYYPLLTETPVDFVCFQYEDLQEPLVLPSGLPTRWGLAITSQTSIEVFDAYAAQCSFILIMATTPGKSGGIFDKSNFNKIRDFRQKYPDKRIHVDGGVNAEVSFIIRNMGVNAAVSGSYLFKEHAIGTALFNLKTADTGSHFLVRDFMRSRHEVPVLYPDRRSFHDVLLSIEHFSLGFTMLARHDDTLEGIISNADVRRGLLRYIHDLPGIRVDDLVNKNPVVIPETYTVTDMIRFIKEQKIPISFLPVVNQQQQVTGALTFFNLIKGEL
jgi:pentose-5-phosphate-3-epimerase